VTIKNWGSLNGTNIKHITISDGVDCSASVITYGAILQDLRTPDATGKIDSIALGMTSIEDYVQHASSMGIIAGRFANRIAFGRYTHKGQTVELDINNGPHHLHGGPKGTAKRIWEFVKADESSVTLGLRIPAYDDGYPGNLEITCSYRFIDKGHLRLELKATVSETCPINLAQHSYFNLEGDASGQIIGHHLQINADQVALTDASGIPVHKLKVDGTPFDFRQSRTPTVHDGQPLALDNSFNLTGSGLREVAKVTAPISGRTMSLLSDQTELQVYSAHGLNVPVAGIGGKPYGAFDGLCLEPQCIPNAPNNADANCFYGPDRPYSQVAEYKFGIL